MQENQKSKNMYDILMIVIWRGYISKSHLDLIPSDQTDKQTDRQPVKLINHYSQYVHTLDGLAVSIVWCA